MSAPLPSPAPDRRTFLKAAAVATGVAAIGRARAAAPTAVAPAEWIDTNVSLARWPLRRLPDDDATRLAARLRGHGVTQAWAGTFDGLLHRDLGAANTRLAAECRRHGAGFFVPFGSINPQLPDWEEELRRCAEEHRMPGIRLHPSYHGVKLDDPGFARLLRLATERSLLVQLVATMEDRRMMHPLLQVNPPDLKPLAGLLRQTPGLRLELLNAFAVLRGPALLEVLHAGEVVVDIAMLEGVGGVGQLLAQVPAERVVFGSHAPLFYFESAALKLQESALTDGQLQAVRSGNARRLLARNS